MGLRNPIGCKKPPINLVAYVVFCMNGLFWLFGFPGVVVHELSHYLACVLTGTKVFRVKFFSLSGPAYVVHARPSAWQGVVISIAPFLIGTIFSFILLSTANAMIGVQNLLVALFYWLAISILYFSFPSYTDAKNAFNSLIRFYEKKLFGKNSLISKIVWTITLPFLFLPSVLIVGLLLVFDYSPFLRMLWVLFFILFNFGVFN